LETKAIHEKLVQHFDPATILALTEAKDGVRDPFVEVLGGKLDEVCLFLRTDRDLAFDFCQSLTGLDTGETLTCVYHLYSYPNRHTLVLKARTPRSQPRLPTISTVWPVANWYEREAYDLYGVLFDGHPDLRRLLLPEDWEGHPMRKDYVQGPRYNGMPTTRENPLDLLEKAASAPPLASEARGETGTEEGSHGGH
jgi:NADH-quinone oxidoreductase subunit C